MKLHWKYMRAVSAKERNSQATIENDKLSPKRNKDLSMNENLNALRSKMKIFWKYVRVSKPKQRNTPAATEKLSPNNYPANDNTLRTCTSCTNSMYSLSSEQSYGPFENSFDNISAISGDIETNSNQNEWEDISLTEEVNEITHCSNCQRHQFHGDSSHFRLTFTIHHINDINKKKNFYFINTDDSNQLEEQHFALCQQCTQFLTIDDNKKSKTYNNMRPSFYWYILSNRDIVQNTVVLYGISLQLHRDIGGYQ